STADRSLSRPPAWASRSPPAKLPQRDACITLGTKIAKNTFEQTKINSGTAITGEVTTAAATQACSSDSNSITWTYSS
ncbi:type 4 pilus major pilin, partial [Pseudomonas aeruginosa]|uniref:type 4 pilus major pilin n=1 Tax=Pseudomonas aeruginosa TaxID=287 RepID=UPI00271385A0